MGVAGEYDETGHAFLPGIQQIQYFLPCALNTARLDVSGQHRGAEIQHDDEGVRPLDHRQLDTLKTRPGCTQGHEYQQEGRYPDPRALRFAALIRQQVRQQLGVNDLGPISLMNAPVPEC